MRSLLYSDLSESSFNNKFKKAKLISGLTQQKLSKLTGLSRSTINDLERGSRNNISRDTLLKLIKVLDKNILCDDYLLFVLNQEKNISSLIDQHGITKLCSILKCNHSSIYRWKVFKNQINSYDLIDFIRDFRIVNKGDGSYINISRNQTVNEKVKKATGLTNLDALFLTEKEINNLFQNCILLDS